MTQPQCLLPAARRFLRLTPTQRAADVAALPTVCPMTECIGTGCREAVAEMQRRNGEDHRRVCEARAWLRAGYTRKPKVDELISRIAARRGAAAADVLRAEMRAQWNDRAAWLAVSP